MGNRIKAILIIAVIIVTLGGVGVASYLATTSKKAPVRTSACLWVVTNCGSGCADNKDLFNCGNVGTPYIAPETRNDPNAANSIQKALENPQIPSSFKDLLTGQTSTPTPTPQTGTGGNTCPSGYIYCGFNIQDCVKSDRTCIQWKELYDSGSLSNALPFCGSLGCDDSQNNFASTPVVGAALCKKSDGGRAHCCIGGAKATKVGSYYYCPGFTTSITDSTGTAGAGQSCEPSGQSMCKGGFVCQGTVGQRVCQQQLNSSGSTANCTLNGGTCSNNYIGFHCTGAFGDKCQNNPDNFTSFEAALSHVAGCGQIDQVWSGGPCNRNLCGQFSIFRESCGGGTTTVQPQPTEPPPPPPGVTAQCVNIKVYDTSWNQLTLTQLSALKAGDVVRFTVTGSASSGSFDKARFTINSVLRPEVTTLKPNTTFEFYDEYTIPDAVTSFTVNAQIHHAGLNTWN